MTVPKSKRSVSEFEFYTNALRIRQRVTEWMLRDFGAKAKVRDLSLAAKKYAMSAEDKALLEALFEKYTLGERIAETFPEWWIDERRHAIDQLCADLVLDIVAAFAIYPTSTTEFEARRVLQNRAISTVMKLLEETQFVIHCLYRTGGVDVGGAMALVQLCEAEIALLKGWKKSGNPVRNAILKKEIAAKAKIQKKLSESASK